eukprot:g561.t1
MPTPSALRIALEEPHGLPDAEALTRAELEWLRREFQVEVEKLAARVSALEACDGDSLPEPTIIECNQTPTAADRQTSAVLLAGGGAKNAGAGSARPKEEVFEEIQHVLKQSPVLQLQFFDFRVRQHLHALFGTGGRQRLKAALTMVHARTMHRTRQEPREGVKRRLLLGKL